MPRCTGRGSCFLISNGFRTNQLTFINVHKILPPRILLNIEKKVPWVPTGLSSYKELSFSTRPFFANQFASREVFGGIFIGSSGTLKNMLPVTRISSGRLWIYSKLGH